ncbi:M48 family metalloprotease [Streptomyces sp. NPDC004539]|uniref:M48 family metalloprotease n=1 Tax=Streptomyces sp. NPDC004539 TaxID=3154280 RepID=UPI0033BB2C3A
MTALLLAGAFAGTLVHNQFFGTEWATGVAHCTQEALERVPGDSIARNAYEQRCVRPFQQRLLGVSLAGSALVVLLGTAGLWVLPGRELRRAGPLEPAPPDWQERVAGAAAELGVRRPPRTVWAGEKHEEPFTAGRPGAVTVVLPRGMRRLDERHADAVIRHEVAHIAAGDVGLVWLTRGALAATALVLLLPPAALVGREWSGGGHPLSAVGNLFWGEYGGRALLLVVLVLLLSQMVLRAREHEADLLSVRGRSAEGLTSWLAKAERACRSRVGHVRRGGGPTRRSGEQMRRGAEAAYRSAEPAHRSRTEHAHGTPAAPTPHTPAGQHPWWQRALANHPPLAHRLTVLTLPHPHLAPTWLDAATTGLLGAIPLDSVTSLAQTGFTGTPLLPYALLTGALAAGTLMSLAWGASVWRSVSATEGDVTVPRRTSLALAAGTALGLVVHLQSTSDHLNGSGSPLVVLPLALASAGALSAPLARMYVRSRRTAPSALAVLGTSVAVNATLFVGVLRVAQELALWTGVFGWRSFDAALSLAGVYSMSATSTAVGLVCLALSALGWTLRGTGRAWLVPLSAAVASAVAATAIRGALPAGADFDAVLQYDRWVAAVAGLAALVAICAVGGGEQLGRALWAAPLATALTSGILWLSRSGFWTHPEEPVDAGRYFGTPLAQLAVFFVLLAFPLALLPALVRRAGWERAAAPVLAAGMAVALALVVVRSDSVLLPTILRAAGVSG